MTLPFGNAAASAAGSAVEGVAVGDRRVEALAARIPVVPTAEVERELVEGRADAAVDVDLARCAVREVDAGAAETDVALQILGEVVARLEVGRDRRLVVRLRDAAEDVVAGDRRTEREIPCRRIWRDNRLGLDRQIGRRSARRQSKSGKSRDRKLLHSTAPSRRAGVELGLMFRGSRQPRTRLEHQLSFPTACLLWPKFSTRDAIATRRKPHQLPPF